MNTLPKRVVVYTKDVANTTALRRRASRKLLSASRRKKGKANSAFITMQYVASYTGIGAKTVLRFLVIKRGRTASFYK